MHFLALPTQGASLLCFSNASQRRSLARHFVSARLHFDALPLTAMLVRCLTGPCFACAFPFGAIPWPVSSTHSLAFPSQSSASPFHSYAVRCLSLPFHRIAWPSTPGSLCLGVASDDVAVVIKLLPDHPTLSAVAPLPETAVHAVVKPLADVGHVRVVEAGDGEL